MNTFIRYFSGIVERASFLCFLLFMFFLPFPWRWTQPFYIAWLVLWFLEGRWLNRNNFHSSKSLIPIFLICLFVTWDALSLLWSHDVDAGVRELSRYFPIYIIGLLALFGTNKYYDTIKIKSTLVLGCLLSILSYGLVIFQHVQTNTIWHFPPFWFTSNLWTVFGDGPIAIIQNRHFYCTILLLALFISIDLVDYFKKQYSSILVGCIAIIVDIIFIGTIILSGSRMAIIFIPVTLLIMFFTRYKGRYLKRIASALVGIGIVFLFVGFMLNPRMITVKQDIKTLFSGDIHKLDNTIEPRLKIFACVLNHKDCYGLYGFGVGGSQVELRKYYAEAGLTHFIERDWTTHNFYLKTWMELGPFAVLFVILILVTSPFFHTGKARKYSLFFCILFGWAMLTDVEFVLMIGLHNLFSTLMLVYLEQRDVEIALKC